MPRVDPLSGGNPATIRAPEEEFEAERLPREHPRWVKDALAVSQRARALASRARPIAIRVLSFWDHGLRGLRIGLRDLTVDSSGSYRLD